MRFDTHGTDSDFKKYDGMECEVLRPLTAEEADIEEVGQMYRVRLSNGVEVDAFEDELSE